MRRYIPIFLVFITCGTMLETAKTANGINVGVGIGAYPWKIEEEKFGYTPPYLYLTGMFKYGVRATKKSPGVDLGYRVYILGLSHKGLEYDLIENLALSSWDIKMQIPENPYMDFAFQIEFWGLSPVQFSLILSKEAKRKVTPFFRTAIAYPGILRFTSGISTKIKRYTHFFLGGDIVFYFQEMKKTEKTGGLYIGFVWGL